MSKLKNIVKNILFSLPVVNFLFIYFNYKIIKTNFSIHGYKINDFIMTKNNHLIYDKNNAGKITGLDNNMNYEFAFSKKIIDLADKNKIFFDVGAAYGHYSWLASELYKEVYCFEGDKLELFFLKKNMKKFKNVKITEKYLTEKFNIDMVIEQLGITPDIIKLDVEGEEIQILENCERAFKSRASFLIEFHKRKIFKKYNNDEMIIKKFFSKFKEYNYKLEFNGHHEFEQLLSEGVSDKEWSDEKLNTNNYAIFASPN